ncbi:hypothetical protein [Cryobacterium sp. TMS1-13-1]|uniref:hypothetical protein n=1 Tax=Cryobacterium sp. TMS1-13-1 TaxID=1259220 RepID=UPI001F54648C|nr:hypothetical protein [Cryobacterium sp. TMS1-13-1]
MGIVQCQSLLLAAALLAPVGLALAIPQSAQAIDDGTLGIRPHSSLTSFTLLSRQGAFALAAQADTSVGVGAWVALDAGEITVPANPFRSNLAGVYGNTVTPYIATITFTIA